MTDFDRLNEAPNYSCTEAAGFLHLKPESVHRLIGDGIIVAPQGGLSFHNLLELHILQGLRKESGLPMQRIRMALDEYSRSENSAHPLLDPRLETDGIHLFLHAGDDYFNLNQYRQMGIPQVLQTYLARIDRLADGEKRFFPFIVGEDSTEPRTIQIAPNIAFGRPVLVGTGIAIDVISGRFRARDSIADLAEEFGVSISMIEDAVRWGLPHQNAA